MAVAVLGQKGNSVQRKSVVSWRQQEKKDNVSKRELQVTDGSRLTLSEEFERVMQAMRVGIKARMAPPPRKVKDQKGGD
jgi:hypothetical protein